MIKKLESILKKTKIWALAGLASLIIGCSSVPKQYIEPRIGLIGPIAEEEENYNASFAVGTCYGISKRGNNSFKEKIGLEASLDYFQSSEQYIETDSFLFGINATYPVRINNPSLYLTGGLSFLSEISVIDIPAPFNVHDEKTNTKTGLSFGANLRFGDTENISVRLSYISLFDSKNVKGIIMLTGGYKF